MKMMYKMVSINFFSSSILKYACAFWLLNEIGWQAQMFYTLFLHLMLQNIGVFYPIFAIEK